jgi:hypothetical protein
VVAVEAVIAEVVAVVEVVTEAVEANGKENLS